MNFIQPPCKNMQRQCNFLPSKTNKQQDFINTIENAIFRIVGAPESWPLTEGQIRRYLTLKFSYAVFYRVYSDRIVIAAIMSCRRDPSYWKDRL